MRKYDHGLSRQHSHFRQGAFACLPSTDLMLLFQFKDDLKVYIRHIPRALIVMTEGKTFLSNGKTVLPFSAAILTTRVRQLTGSS